MSTTVNISIPISITSIKNFAFSKCSKLAEIKIPSSAVSLGNSEFEYCKSMIKIPYSVVSIGDSSFSQIEIAHSRIN